MDTSSYLYCIRVEGILQLKLKPYGVQVTKQIKMATLEQQNEILSIEMKGKLTELLSNLKGTDFKLIESNKFSAYNYPYLFSKSTNVSIDWNSNLDSLFQINNDGYLVGDGFTSIIDTINALNSNK